MRSAELIAKALAKIEPIARAEILVALQEPQRKLIRLINARTRDLEDLRDLEDDFANLDFGAF